jgi:hypothetical protein
MSLTCTVVYCRSSSPVSLRLSWSSLLFVPDPRVCEHCIILDDAGKTRHRDRRG